MIRSTYIKCKVQLTDGEHDLRIGLNDQEAAFGKMGIALEDIPETQGSESQKWLRYAAWQAAKRDIGYTGTLEAWSKTFIGLDMDDGENPPTAAPA